MSVYEKLLSSYTNKNAQYWVLIDPDDLPQDKIPSFMEKLNGSGVDIILVGGSLILNSDFDHYVGELKKHSGSIPVVLFPGGAYQVSARADAILFLSLLSGREAYHLISNQVLAAPIVYRSKLEPIPTAYMLVESGKPTSAQFMSGTTPLPRDKPDIAVAHALAAQYLGFKLIYLEAGSGAELSVPEEMIAAVSRTVNIPLIVGGGIKTPEQAAAKVAAGASFIVTGNALENNEMDDLILAFSDAVHHNREE
jgi:putative glycerol-1-phosphate prenyltransferase